MDFSGIAADTSRQVYAAISYILALSISPVDKMSRITKVLRSVGLHYHSHVYADAARAFGAEVISTAGLVSQNSQEERLANKLVRNYALGRETAPLVAEYYDSVLGRAQSEAFQNAVSMQRHPTLTRTVVGETCDWCDAKAGTHTNPDSEDFARHRDCDCLFEVSGYNTRNGLLTNYVKRG